MSDASAGRYIGQSVRRFEDPRLLTGHGTYIDDVAVPGMLHAAFVRSSFAHGRIRRVDSTAAAAVDGVVAVLFAADLAANYRPTWSSIIGRAAVSAQPLRPLADQDVRFAGDPVAIVIARSRHIAEDGAELVEVDIEPLPPVLDVTAARNDRLNLVHPEVGTNVAGKLAADPDPQLEEIFAAAPHVITETIHQHRYIAVPMEGRGLIASWEPHVPQLTIWSATQAPHEVRSWCARMLDLPEHRIRVLMGDVGGGFGQKMFTTREEMAVVIASYQLGQPVKWIEDRSENLLAAGHAREEHATASMAVDHDGRILAARVTHTANVGSYSIPPAGNGAGVGVKNLFPGPYKIPRLSFESEALYTNTCGRTPYRGPWMFETVLREQMVDIVARALGKDPLELRRINVVRPADLPYTSATGLVYERISPAESLEQAAELIGYEDFRREQAAAREKQRYLGIGFGLYVEPSQTGGSMASEGAILRIDPGGTVTLIMGTASHGQSTETTMAQIVAEHLGCPIEDIVFIQGDTALTPWGPGTGGSRTAIIAAGAAQEVAVQMRVKVLDIAAHLLEASPRDLEISDGVISVKGDPAITLSLRDIAEAAYLSPGTLAPGTEPGLLTQARSLAPPLTLSNACHACIVEVDVRTGRVRVLRYVVSEDCGRMINPMVVQGQIAGGVVQGLGGVLYEHMIYDDDGNPLTTTFLDYLLPTAAEVPEIEYGHLATPANTPGGFKGMGEGGAIGSPAAVVNAVADALACLGVRITDQPLGPEQIVAALEAAGV